MFGVFYELTSVLSSLLLSLACLIILSNGIPSAILAICGRVAQDKTHTLPVEPAASMALTTKHASVLNCANVLHVTQSLDAIVSSLLLTNKPGMPSFLSSLFSVVTFSSPIAIFGLGAVQNIDSRVTSYPRDHVGHQVLLPVGTTQVIYRGYYVDAWIPSPVDVILVQALMAYYTFLDALRLLLLIFFILDTGIASHKLMHQFSDCPFTICIVIHACYRLGLALPCKWFLYMYSRGIVDCCVHLPWVLYSAEISYIKWQRLRSCVGLYFSLDVWRWISPSNLFGVQDEFSDFLWLQYRFSYALWFHLGTLMKFLWLIAWDLRRDYCSKALGYLGSSIVVICLCQK